ncbi:hypothetical protein JK159_02395 [Weissella minor]|uniref:hypothetical protein n=1 Tax=Weissella minor TaxID=1620 RepID=UPI001BAED1A1|nr:hypothetical protein [Weissella minor]MBS0949233.1 hypothetical protein [Weissella minor]
MKKLTFNFEETVVHAIEIEIPSDITLTHEDYKAFAEIAQIFYDAGLVEFDHDKLVSASLSIGVLPEEEAVD